MNNQERYGTHRGEFERNRKLILKRDDVCALCGKEVDKKLKYPHPLSATIDHKVPVSKGGHPSDIANLQLAHFCCNRKKSDSFQIVESNGGRKVNQNNEMLNRDLPKIIDWESYRSK